MNENSIVSIAILFIGIVIGFILGIGDIEYKMSNSQEITYSRYALQGKSYILSDNKWILLGENKLPELKKRSKRR